MASAAFPSGLACYSCGDVKAVPGKPDAPPDGLWGGRLAAARAARGWTQTELAYHAGINAAEVSRYETGSRQPLASVLARLARALEVPSDYLLGLTDERSTP